MCAVNADMKLQNGTANALTAANGTPFEEVELAVRTGGAKSKPTTVRDISDKIVGIGGVDASYNEIRYATGLKELDRVLGGGL